MTDSSMVIAIQQTGITMFVTVQISIVKRLREDLAPTRGYGGRGGHDRFDRGYGGGGGGGGRWVIGLAA